MDTRPVALAKNRAQSLLDRLEAALAAGEIDEAGWYREVAAVITPAYLAADNPRSQSGKDGDEADWERARSLLADAVHRDGAFLDVGSASGYLMECMERWAAERGHILHPYGLDIAPELADLARRRLPRWADRIYVGNVIDWQPPRRFDVVRTGLEYVPVRRHRDLIARLLEKAVAPGGRLLIGVYSEEREAFRTGPRVEEEIAGWGFPIGGRVERPHPRDARLVYRVVWIDSPPGASPQGSDGT